MSRETNMTVGRPTKLILGLAVPLILTNVGQQLYTVADASIVGRGVGVEALAALGATDWLYWLVLWTVQAMTQGFSVLVSQTFGSNDKKGLRKAITMSVLLCAAVGILLTVVFVSSAGWLLHLLDTPENIYDGAHIYLTMMYAGTLITMAYNMAAAILRALGDGKSPLIAMFTAGCLNIVLDLLFVIRFGWGIPGAAAATLLAQLFAFAYCVIALRKIPAASVEKPDWQPDSSVIRRLCHLGLPLALQHFVIVISGIVLYPAAYYKEKGSDLSKYKVTKRGCKFNLQPLLRLFSVDSGAVIDNQRAEQLFGQVEFSVLIAKQPALARQLLDSRLRPRGNGGNAVVRPAGALDDLLYLGFGHVRFLLFL